MVDDVVSATRAGEAEQEQMDARARAWNIAGQRLGMSGLSHTARTSFRVVDDLIARKLSPDERARLAAISKARSCVSACVPALTLPLIARCSFVVAV